MSLIVSNEAAGSLISRTPGSRILALDALRGIAAAVVVLHHLRFAFYMTEPRWYFRPLFAGRSAVMLFFVLSGYVLSLPYWHGRQSPYPVYLIKRFFRIYVPYAAGTIIAVLVGEHLLYSHLPLDIWFYKTWQTAFSTQILLNQFLLISISPVINTAFWSLRYEMQMSILFPAVCWLLSKLRPAGSLLLVLLLPKAGTWGQSHTSNAYLVETCNTLIYGSYFVYGALLAWKRAELKVLYEKTPRWLKALIFAVTIFCYFHIEKPFFVPLAACVIILFAQHGRAKRFLDTPLPEYLGRISYAMYLTHGTVLFATLILLYGKMPLPVIVAIYLSVSLLVAHLFNRFVEEPSMRLGKRISSSIRD